MGLHLRGDKSGDDYNSPAQSTDHLVDAGCLSVLGLIGLFSVGPTFE